MGPKKPERKAAFRQSTNLSNADLYESVQTNLEVSRKQIKRSRQVASDSREIIVKVRQSLAQSELIQQGLSGQSPRNPVIMGEKIR